MIEFGIAMTVAIVGSVIGDLCVKKGAGRRGDSGGAGAGVAARLRRFFTDPWLIAGIALLTLNFAGMLAALKLGPVTVVVPLMSCTYVLTTVLAKTVLREKITPLRWGGIVVIMLGVAVLGLSTLSTPSSSGPRLEGAAPAAHPHQPSLRR